ncbi:MAG: acyltransferase [Edaphobacter sp.]
MDLNQITDARGPSHTPGIKRRPDLKALTSIRFFAALHVALFHLVQPFSLWGPLAPVIGAGYIGVSFFFVLSGFILAYSRAGEYERGEGHAPKFWMARFARIYPVYLVSMIFAGYVGRAQFHQKIHIVAFIADLLMVQSWSVRTVNFFNGPAWSLSCEAVFYLVFPFVFMKLRPSTLKKGILAFAGGWLLALAVPLLSLKLYPLAAWHIAADGAPGAIMVTRIRHIPILLLPQFLAGISLGWIYLRFRPSPKLASFFASAGVITLAATLMLADHIPYILLHNGLLVPIFGLLILGLAESNWLSRLLSNPVLVILGEASYALYLIHRVFDAWLLSVFGPSGGIWSAVWKLAIVIPLSVLLHLFVERPCRLLILKWWSRRHPKELTVGAN